VKLKVDARDGSSYRQKGKERRANCAERRRRGLMRILIVEDEPTLQRTARGALGAAGYAVDAADNGVDAHFRATAKPYDAVCSISACRRWTASPCCRNGAPAAARCRC
jgi:PleD family two-component response regulator